MPESLVSVEPDDHSLGRSRGGLTSKVHLAVAASMHVLAVIITAGQRGDAPQFLPLMQRIRVSRPAGGRPRTRPDHVLADRAYSSRAIRSDLRRRGIAHTIPEKQGQAGHRLRRGSAGTRRRVPGWRVWIGGLRARNSGRSWSPCTFNAEARLSLKALEPDPLQAFADRTVVGQELRGTVEKVLPIGIFVDLGDGVFGLVPFRETHGRPAASPAGDFEVGEEIAVVVAEIDRPTRRVFLSRPESAQHAGVVLPT